MRPVFLFLAPLLMLPLACTDTPVEPETEAVFESHTRPDPGNYIKAQLSCRGIQPGNATFQVVRNSWDPPDPYGWENVTCSRDKEFAPIPSDWQFPFFVHWTVECTYGEDSGIRQFDYPNKFKVPFEPDAYCYHEVTLKLEYVTID